MPGRLRDHQRTRQAPTGLNPTYDCPVRTGVRGQGGRIADEALSVVREVACEEARAINVNLVVLTGHIHTKNRPSESLFVRSGFEPHSVPIGEYQEWRIRIQIDD